MLKIEEVTMKNFYSIGNVTQTVKIKDGSTTLIMGDNVDYGSGESGTIRNGVGKAQPLNSKIRVANGWKTMMNIKTGDIVMTPEGGSAVVIGKYPQGQRTVYEIKTRDGKKTLACKEHLWELYDGSVVSTSDIYGMLKNKIPVYLPTSKSEMDSYRNIEIDPYLIGVLLTSGIVREVDGVNKVVLNVIEQPIIERLLSKTKLIQTYDGLIIQDSDMPALKQFFNFEKGKIVLIDTLVNTAYDTRCEIIRGVFDTVFDIKPHGYYADLVGRFDNPNIAKEVRNIIWSIGGICYKRLQFNANVYGSNSTMLSSEYTTLTVELDNISEYFTFEKFEFNRVKTDAKNEIVSITKVGKEEVCCIKISSDRQLYITDDFIPTHNTTVINAISYALYGDTITKPKKKAAIINYINGKDLLVTLKFSVDGNRYYIERGQKPTIIKFTKINDDGSEEDLAQGSTSNTDEYIVKIIGMSHLLCKYIMLMSTYAEPFMNEDAAKQRSIIEELLGIGELSEKAEKIKDKEKFYSIELEKEQVRIKTLIESNSRVERAISDMIAKSEAWNKRQKMDIDDIGIEIEKYKSVDIKQEIENHKLNSNIESENHILEQLDREKNKITSILKEIQNVMVIKSKKLDEVSHLGVCHECKQTLGEEEHKKQQTQITIELNELITRYDSETMVLNEINKEITKYIKRDKIKTFYKTIEQAYEHEKSVSVLMNEYENLKSAKNPFDEQIENLRNTDYGIQEIDYSKVEEYENILKHYKYLKKLLTHKDSFLRKVIINRSLPFLNNRLKHYLTVLSLPHHVVFDADLTFNITHMGLDSDYSLLSRGEQNRVTYALNLAFRDLFESTRKEVNVLFVDELLDFGVDSTGAIAGLQILKNISYNGRSTYLVTHKEELIERVPNIIYVKKENGFTTYQEQEN